MSQQNYYSTVSRNDKCNIAASTGIDATGNTPQTPCLNIWHYLIQGLLLVHNPYSCVCQTIFLQRTTNDDDTWLVAVCNWHTNMYAWYTDVYLLNLLVIITHTHTHTRTHTHVTIMANDNFISNSNKTINFKERTKKITVKPEQ